MLYHVQGRKSGKCSTETPGWRTLRAHRPSGDQRGGGCGGRNERPALYCVDTRCKQIACLQWPLSSTGQASERTLPLYRHAEATKKKKG